MPHPAVLAGCVIAGAATVVALEIAVFKPWREEHAEEFVHNAHHHWNNFRREWNSAFEEMNPVGRRERERRKRQEEVELVREVEAYEAYEMEQRQREEREREFRHEQDVQRMIHEEQEMKRRYDAEMNGSSEPRGQSTQVDCHQDTGLTRRRRASGNLNDASLADFNHTIGEESPPDGTPLSSPASTGLALLSTPTGDDGVGEGAVDAFVSSSSQNSQDAEERTLTDQANPNPLEDQEEEHTPTSSFVTSPSTSASQALSGPLSPFEDGSASPLSAEQWQHASTMGCRSEDGRSDAFSDVHHSSSGTDEWERLSDSDSDSGNPWAKEQRRIGDGSTNA